MLSMNFILYDTILPFLFCFCISIKKVMYFSVFSIETWLVLWTLLLVLGLWSGIFHRFRISQEFLLLLYILDYRYYVQCPWVCVMTVMRNPSTTFIVIKQPIEFFFAYATNFIFFLFSVFYFFAVIVRFMTVDCFCCIFFGLHRFFFIGFSPPVCFCYCQMNGVWIMTKHMLHVFLFLLYKIHVVWILHHLWILYWVRILFASIDNEIYSQRSLLVVKL